MKSQRMGGMRVKWLNVSAPLWTFINLNALITLLGKNFYAWNEFQNLITAYSRVRNRSVWGLNNLWVWEKEWGELQKERLGVHFQKKLVVGATWIPHSRVVVFHKARKRLFFIFWLSYGKILVTSVNAFCKKTRVLYLNKGK